MGVASAPCVRGKNEHMVVLANRCVGIADKPVAVQVRRKCRVQPGALAARRNKFAHRRNLPRQCFQKLTQCGGLNFDGGNAGTLAWKPEELNLHNVPQKSRGTGPDTSK